MTAGKRTTPVWKWVMLIVLLIYTCVVGAWAYARSADDKCRGVVIEITGDHRNDSVIREGVLAHLYKYVDPVGKSRAIINTRAIEEWVGVLNNLENVECGFDSDGMLRVSVTPLVPEMRVFTPAGGSYYVNSAGKRMDAKAEFFSEVPIVMGAFSPSMPPTMLRPVLRAIRADKTMAALVTMLEVKEGGDIILVPRFRGHVINIGDTNRLDEKFRYLKAFYSKVLPYRGWNSYDTISVKFRNQVVATRADKSVATHGALILEEDAETEEASLEGANLGADPSSERKSGEETPADNNTKTKTNI